MATLDDGSTVRLLGPATPRAQPAIPACNPACPACSGAQSATQRDVGARARGHRAQHARRVQAVQQYLLRAARRAPRHRRSQGASVTRVSQGHEETRFPHRHFIVPLCWVGGGPPLQKCVVRTARVYTYFLTDSVTAD
eukprot:scaffold110590_cov39-Phaeocystis_antarctica.AAC.1